MTDSGKRSKRTIFTLGHADLSFGDFLELLRDAGVQILVDIRTVPRSKHVPHFNQQELRERMPAHGITYHHIKELGGKGRKPLRRSPNRGLSKVWQAYADHMLSQEFERGLLRLLALASIGTVALLCAEAKWDKCHRRLLSDALVIRGNHIVHLAPGVKTEHVLTPGLDVQKNRLTYPALGEQLSLFTS